MDVRPDLSAWMAAEGRPVKDALGSAIGLAIGHPTSVRTAHFFRQSSQRRLISFAKAGNGGWRPRNGWGWLAEAVSDWCGQERCEKVIDLEISLDESREQYNLLMVAPPHCAAVRINIESPTPCLGLAIGCRA